MAPNALNAEDRSPPARPSRPSLMLTALPVATTAKAKTGTMSQPRAMSPMKGTNTVSNPSLYAKNQPNTSPRTVMRMNFKLERSPATPVPAPRRLMMSSSSPTAPPPTRAANGSHVWARSRLNPSVTAVTAMTAMIPAMVGMLRLNFSLCNLVNTSNFSPVVLV